MTDSTQNPSKDDTPARPVYLRPHVMSGLMFIAFGVFGLAVSWNYPIGTAIRMGTGYVPRLMLWVLLAIGIVVLITGIINPDEEGSDPPLQWRPLVLVPASLLAFALAMDNELGFVVAGILLILIGGMAFRGARIVEVLLSTAVLVFFSWAIFVWALGLTLPVWPGG